MLHDIPRAALKDREPAFAALNEALPEGLSATNLDALFDVLTEVTDLTLRLTGPAPEGAFYPRVLRVLKDAEQENPRFFLLEMPEQW